MTASMDVRKEMLSIEEILTWTGGICLTSGASVCTGVFTDSRKVIPGGLFVALIGNNFNGNQFVEQALQQGAAAALVSEKDLRIPGKTVIYVPDTLAALQNMAQGYRRKFLAKVVAITGSVGKTTTKDLLAWCLESQYRTLKTEANHNNDIGVPETLLKLEEKVEVAIVEMGMRARGEIERLSRIAEPDVALITNIAPVHLETLGSLENIAQAKCEIFSHLSSQGWGMIAGDSPLLRQEAQKTGCQIYTFGMDPACDCCLQNTEINKEGMKIQVRLFDWQGILEFPLPSEAIAFDVVAAAGCAYRLGVEPKKIVQALANYTGDEQRLHIQHLKEGGLVLNDTYNANPLSMAAALEVLCFKAGKRHRVAVLGDMYELGNFETEGHLQVGKKVAELSIDQLITIGSLGEIIAEGAKKAGMSSAQICSFPDQKSALIWMRDHVKGQDAVLFKASHGLHLDVLLEKWAHGGEESHDE